MQQQTSPPFPIGRRLRRQRASSQDGTGESNPSDQADLATFGGPQPKTRRASDPAPSQLAAANGSASNGEEATTAAAAARPAVGAAFHHGQELELEGLACLVKVYDFREGQVKLNDVVEFVGVLGYDQTPPPQDGMPIEGETGQAFRDPFQGLEDFSRKVPPPSLAPRLHCVCEKLVLGAEISCLRQFLVRPLCANNGTG